VDGVPPEGALTITLLSIGDVVSVKVLVGTIIKSLSLLVISAEISNDYYIFGLLLDLFCYSLHSGVGCEVSDSSPRLKNSGISFATTFARIERSSGSVSCPKI